MKVFIDNGSVLIVVNMKIGGLKFFKNFILEYIVD